MIPFKMKILKFNDTSSSYTVEYKPQHNKCTPLTLEIHVNVNDPNNLNEVLALLKLSSPQDYWQKEARKDSNQNTTLQSLVNTEHHVDDVVIDDRVVSGRTSPSNSPFGEDSDDSYIMQSVQPRRQIQNTREQVAGPAEISNLRLKLAIQQVLREMAEGTV